MLASRFWYVVLALVLGASLFVLQLATSMYNRAGLRAMDEGLSSDSQVVSWYLRNDARERSAQLIKFALNQDIAKDLQKASGSEDKVPDDVRARVLAALKKVNQEIPEEDAFDAVFAVDQHGRVVAHLGYDQASGMSDFELGGYPVVADALHGYVRDDTLQLDRLYRVVARPVEFDLGSLPAGAVVGARVVDQRFARVLSQRTGAAVAFYMDGASTVSAAPEGFDRTQLDQINSDLSALAEDESYQKLGRSSARMIGGNVRVVYSLLPGEAGQLGAGYVVGRLPAHVSSPFDFFRQADDKDKAQVNLVLVVGVALGAALLGLLFSFFEHTQPINSFRAESVRLAKGEVDQLTPSKFRGVFRKIASDINDGVDALVAKGGGSPRRAADLGKVLGDIPDQPVMSAFSFPGDTSAAAPASVPASEVSPEPARALPSPPGARSLPKPKPAAGAAEPAPAATAPAGPAGGPPAPPRREPPKPPGPPERASGNGEVGDEQAEWQKVYQDFVATKQQCGEKTEGFTYEKFEQTLKKNREALMARHQCSRVKFSVYVKDGKAALKASPIKD
ncbi:MAG: hypothetical protein KIT72_14930 [Polyangiaceae bacterium]|nr:hypothetical protein [Polyangiaceae bacterium]MCW5791710.1 hypothetical protein [Polyangiaceae bacterium]